MTMTITQIHPHFVGAVEGVDLSRPLASGQAAELRDAIDRLGVLVFRGQPVSDDEQVAFSKTFGPLELSKNSNVTRPEDRRLRVDMADVSNLDKDGALLPRTDRRRMFNLGNRLWHSDSSFRVIPANFSLLSCRSKTSHGGNTEFTFMPAAYDALDAETKAEMEGLITEHSLLHSRGKLGFTAFNEEERDTFKPVRHALVRQNEATGRKTIYLSSHIGEIIGWPRPEALDFIRQLEEHATNPAFRYAHVWEVGDLVIWDNRQTMHRVTPFPDMGEKRDMRRTTVAGDGPTAEQVPDASAASSAA